MTLSTNVYVQGEINPHDVFNECRRLLGAGPQHPFTDGPSYGKDGTRLLANQMGLGLPALLWMHYRLGAPIKANEAACDRWCDEDCDRTSHLPAHWIDVDFDTAYSYRDKQGRGCGDLHASLVAQLGQWLDDRGVPWCWQNEFTGDIHGGTDRYERLFDLCSAGAEASAWFESMVLPAIGAELRRRREP